MILFSFFWYFLCQLRCALVNDIKLICFSSSNSSSKPLHTWPETPAGNQPMQLFDDLRSCRFREDI